MLESILRRVLQAVFGGGADIDFAARTDALQSIQWEHRLERSLNDFFNTRAWDGTNPTFRVNLDDYVQADGSITCPQSLYLISAYSRRPFHYGSFFIRTKLPEIGTFPGQRAYWGFEQGAGAPFPTPHCRIIDTDISFGTGGAILAITDYLPADYATVEHTYEIKLNLANAEFFIDRVLKAIILVGLSEALPQWTAAAGGPYALFYSLFPHIVDEAIFLEIQPRNVSDFNFPINIDYNNFLASDGPPLPPRQYALYTENTTTKWKGLATAGAVLTSHPVPVWGYPRKTLVFQADAAGNLDIQVYVGGGWRPWVPGGITLVADQLEVYNLNGEIPIARCVYTPTNADTITLAEWHLG